MKGKGKINDILILVILTIGVLLIAKPLNAIADSGPGTICPTFDNEQNIYPNNSLTKDSKKSKNLLSPDNSKTLKNGLSKDYSIKFKDKIFSFKSEPIANLNGDIYISTKDPDFAELFKNMGLSYTWFSYSQKLFIYLPQGSINWKVTEDFAKVGDKKVEVPLKARNNFSTHYIPLRTLSDLLDLNIEKTDNYAVIKPAVQFAVKKSKESGTLDFFINSATEIKYKVSYTSNPPAVRFVIPHTGYRSELKRINKEGVKIIVNDTLKKDKIYITMKFPSHWKGVVTPNCHKNSILVRMKPNLFYTYGTKTEKLKSVETSSEDGQIYFKFNASAAIQYYWAYNSDTNKLLIDLPFVKTEDEIIPANLDKTIIKSCKVSSLKPDGVDITRLEMELEQGYKFIIGAPEEQDGYSFALLIGPREKIASPSPEVGASGIVVAGGRIIVIDPGHGGGDPGACYNGLKEKDITLDIAKRMADILSRQGWKVILTRNTDTDLTYPHSPDAEELQARCNVANKNNAAIFISIHCNAARSPKYKGSYYYWSKPKDKALAQTLIGCLGENIGTIDKGIRRDSFYVLNHTKAPSVLIETAFMSNKIDNAILKSLAKRQVIAEQLSKALSSYFNTQNIASTPANNNNQAEEE